LKFYFKLSINKKSHELTSITEEAATIFSQSEQRSLSQSEQRQPLGITCIDLSEERQFQPKHLS
jgi:hypothetical protein